MVLLLNLQVAKQYNPVGLKYLSGLKSKKKTIMAINLADIACFNPEPVKEWDRFP